MTIYADLYGVASNDPPQKCHFSRFENRLKIMNMIFFLFFKNFTICVIIIYSNEIQIDLIKYYSMKKLVFLILIIFLKFLFVCVCAPFLINLI